MGENKGIFCFKINICKYDVNDVIFSKIKALNDFYQIPDNLDRFFFQARKSQGANLKKMSSSFQAKFYIFAHTS